MGMGWKYYNHAIVSEIAPHEEVDLKPIKDGSIWNINRRAVLVRWISDWDCSTETSFWYVIKDNEYDISSIKSKRRYEINKGRKHFTCKRIKPEKYTEQIYDIAKKAFSAYPSKYRPDLIEQSFKLEVRDVWPNYSVFGAFDVDNKLCGYAYLIDHDGYSEFSVLKSDPAQERYGINAALVDGILMEYNNKLCEGNYYICDGARAIRHQTNFQDYLEKYFGFRKSYCQLHVIYKWYAKCVIILLKPFHKLLSNSNNKLLYNLSSLIEMDSLVKEIYS